MTCKDCIYFKRCVVLGVELDMHHNKEAEKNCRHFKNKADFAEVVHGEWIEDDYGYFHCSECGYEHDSPEYITPYCPHCGAKMGEEE